MRKLSNPILRALLFTVLILGLIGSALSLMLALVYLLFHTQAEAYTYYTTLEYVLLHTPGTLTFVPVLLLFIGVCLGKSSGNRLRALYTASLIVTLLLAVCGMLTDFYKNGIPDGTTALRNSLVFLPLLLLTADALLEHPLTARFAAPVQLALCVLQMYRLYPTDIPGFLPGHAFLEEAFLQEFLRLLYFLAVTMLLFGYRTHTGRAARKKIARLEAALTEAKEQYESGSLTEEEYRAKKAQILNAL